MTKARTNAQKLAEKRRRALADAAPMGLPELAPIPRHEKNGQPSRRGKPRSADVETLKSRCIQMGKSITPANIREMRAPWWGCTAGRTIGQMVMQDQERQALWDAIIHMRRVRTAFDASKGVPRRHAVCLRLLAPVDEMHADAETPPPDLRTDVEKVREAESRMIQLETWLGYTDKMAMGEAKRVVWDDAICTDPEGLIAALRCVSDGLNRRKMKYRGRHNVA